MATIEFDHLFKQFEGQGEPAVNDLTLTVGDGELLVVLGPSGCGKSTLLRILAGLEESDGGDIRIDGRSVIDLEPRDRDIALVFQQYALYPHLSARDNILYPLKVRNVAMTERQSRLSRAATMLNLQRLLGRKPAQLSGGEQQRVALGRAIVREPKAFLMDEPLSNLDAKLRTHMRTEIKALVQELGTTTFFVTHDQSEAMTLADRIAVMSTGRIQQVGTPDEVYQHPANLFVAEFIGSPPMNLLQAEADGAQLVVADRWRIPSPTPSRGRPELGASPGTDLTVGLRPEAIQLSQTPVPDAFPAQVFLTEPLGSEVIVNVRLGDEIVKVRTAPDVRPAPHDTVYLTARADGVRLFDRATGRALVG
jgi:ABC-type sugar transport system ATPase subunit